MWEIHLYTFPLFALFRMKHQLGVLACVDFGPDIKLSGPPRFQTHFFADLDLVFVKIVSCISELFDLQDI